MSTPPPVERQFFFRLSAELLEIHEADLRLNILTRDDGEVTNLKITGMDKDGMNPCVRVEDVEGDEFYIFIAHIISITPVEAYDEEDEDDEPAEDDDETTEEDA